MSDHPGEIPPPGVWAVAARLLLVAVGTALFSLFPLSLTASSYVQAGDRALEAGDFDAAIAAYHAAATAAPGDALPLDRAARAEAAAGRFDEAERDLRRLAAMAGWTAERYRRLGEALSARGETQAAVTAWQAALEIDPEDAGALRALAGAYVQAKDWAQAVAALERLTTVDPGDAAARYRLGLLAAAYDPETAVQHLSMASANPAFTGAATEVMRQLDALAGEPDRAFADAQLAVTLMALEEWAMAEHALSQALLLNPAYAEARAYLGLVRDRQGQDGLPDLLEAVELAPENALTRYALGSHYIQVGDYDAAIPLLIQAASLEPNNPAIVAELAAAYRGRGDLEDAERWLRRAAELDRENVFFWEQLAAFYADTGYRLKEGGLTAIHTAAQRAPDSADVHASLGWALYQAGDGEAARREIEQALALDPRNPRALYYHGVLREVAGDEAGAIDAYRGVLTVAPGSELAALAERGLGRLASRDE